MALSKRTLLKATVFAVTIICLLLSGCQLFTAGKKRLNEYCPGLNVSINGVNWSSNSSGSVFVLKYDRGYQKKVSAYFADPANGYKADNGRGYSDIKTNDKPEIDDDDAIVGKTIDKGKTTAKVVFDESTSKIIIIETVEK
jgi:hypothetical protein